MLLLAALWIGMSAQAVTAGEQLGAAHHYTVQELEAQGWEDSQISVCLFRIYADGRKELEGDGCPLSVIKEAGKASGETDGLTHCMKSDGTPCGAADETEGKPPKCVPNVRNCICGSPSTCRDYTPQEWAEFQREMDGPAKPAEAVDVPAVQEPTESECGASWHHEEVYILCTNHGTPDLPKGTAAPLDRPIPGKDGYITTCSDKSRILLHDESNPPKFWCHRVQSQ